MEEEKSDSAGSFSTSAPFGAPNVASPELLQRPVWRIFKVRTMLENITSEKIYRHLCYPSPSPRSRHDSPNARPAPDNPLQAPLPSLSSRQIGGLSKNFQSRKRGLLLGNVPLEQFMKELAMMVHFLLLKKCLFLIKKAMLNNAFFNLNKDIKCANILVHANGSIKLADFGLAKEISKFNELKSCKRSVQWMAPEVVHPKKTSGRAADIWSLGCTVLEMLTHQIPFPNVEWQHAFFKIGRGDQPPIPGDLSSDAQDFIRKCVLVDPNSRPSAAQLLEHPFVTK